MEHSINVNRQSAGSFRWTCFLIGIFFTCIWIVAPVISGGNGQPMSDTDRLLCILFLFPMLWGIGFVPWKQQEKVTVDRTGVSTIDSFSRTIFHRTVFSSRFVPACSVSHIQMSFDAENDTFDVRIWHVQSNGKPACVSLRSNLEELEAEKVAIKTACLLGCEVKEQDDSESA